MGCGRVGFETIESGGSGDRGTSGAAGAGDTSGVAGDDGGTTRPTGGAPITGGYGGVTTGGAGYTGGTPTGGAETTGGTQTGGSAETGAAGGTTGEGGMTGDGGDAGTAGAGVVGAGGSGGGEAGTGGAGGSASGAAGTLNAGGIGGEFGGAGGNAGSAPVYDGPSPTCSRAGTYERSWSFDIDEEGWMADGTLSWASSDGHSSAGALHASVDLSGGNISYVHSPGTSLGDLSGRMITTQVRLEAGTKVTAKLYVRDTSYNWADAGAVAIPVGAWFCLSLAVSNPFYTDGVFDPTQVRDIGIELRGDGMTSLWVDDVGY